VKIGDHNSHASADAYVGWRAGSIGLASEAPALLGLGVVVGVEAWRRDEPCPTVAAPSDLLVAIERALLDLRDAERARARKAAS
jgi:hypothetical protein